MDWLDILYLVSAATDIPIFPGEEKPRAGLATTTGSSWLAWLIIAGALLFCLGFGYYFVVGRFA